MLAPDLYLKGAGPGFAGWHRGWQASPVFASWHEGDRLAYGFQAGIGVADWPRTCILA